VPTVGEIVKKTTGFFAEKGFSTARLDSELLIANALGWERLQVFLKFDYPLSDAELEKCREMVRRRLKGEPIAYIVGEKGFYKYTFKVTPATLIPRPETEMLVERGLEILTSKQEAPGLTLVDFGCGTGCISLSIASEFLAFGLRNLEEGVSESEGTNTEAKRLRVVLADISEAALMVARENASRLKLDTDERVQLEFRVADAGDVAAWTDLKGQVDLIVANPPYIDPDDQRVEPAVREFEPAQALFAGGPGEEGLSEIRRWSLVAESLLKSGGRFLMEIGDRQGEAVTTHLNGKNWNDVTLAKDLSDRERMIEAGRRELHG
jgi:release factor glutamine methyltransferase